MDPNEALALIRNHANDAFVNGDADAAFAALEAFDGLDKWLSNDGFLPDDWRAEEDK